MGGNTLMSLLVKLGVDTKTLTTGLTKAEGTAKKSGNKISGSLSGIAKAAIFGGVIAGVGALTTALGSCVKEAMAAEVIETQLNAVLKSTQGISGMTAESVSELALELSKVTRYEDDVIIAGQNMLLTFTSIGKDVFPAATEAMLNMSTAMGTDLQTTAIQLGKALQDPIAGITALKRVGVNFTDAQKDLIKRLMETNDLAGAQAVILKELNVEFGGSARAAGTTFAGQLDILNNQIKNIKESIGKALIPVLSDLINVFLGTYDAAVKASDGLTLYEQGMGNFAKAIDGLKTGLMSLIFVFMMAKGLLHLLSTTMVNTNGVMADLGDTSEVNRFTIWKQIRAWFGEKEAIDLTSEAARALGRQIPKVTAGIRVATTTVAEHREAMLDGASAYHDSAREALLFATSQETAKRSMENITNYINSDFGQSQADFIQSQADLEVEMAGVNQQIKDAEALYGAESKQVQELKGTYADLKGQYDDNAKEHEDATKRIILGIVAQQMALQGIVDPTAFAMIAKNWGLIDEAAVTLTKNTALAVNWFKDHPGDYAGFLNMLNGVYAAITPSVEEVGTLAQQIDDLDGKTATVTLNTMKITYEAIMTLPAGWHPGDPVPAYAGGADFIVPYQYTNDSYLMAVGAGEHVTVTPPGQEDRGGGDTYNYNIYGAKDDASMVEKIKTINMLYNGV